MTWKESRPTFVESYMSEDRAREHAGRIGGTVHHVWASGIDTWHVHTSQH